LFLSQDSSPEVFQEALGLGALGYVYSAQPRGPMSNRIISGLLLRFLDGFQTIGSLKNLTLGPLLEFRTGKFSEQSKIIDYEYRK